MRVPCVLDCNHMFVLTLDADTRTPPSTVSLCLVVRQDCLFQQLTSLVFNVKLFFFMAGPPLSTRPHVRDSHPDTPLIIPEPDACKVNIQDALWPCGESGDVVHSRAWHPLGGAAWVRQGK